MSADLANLDPRRVLIIKPSAIGDVVHTLPILRLVRNRWPAAKISWLVTPACSGLLEGHPLLDEVILFDRKRFAGLWRSPRLLGEWRADGSCGPAQPAADAGPASGPSTAAPTRSA